MASVKEGSKMLKFHDAEEISLEFKAVLQCTDLTTCIFEDTCVRFSMALLHKSAPAASNDQERERLSKQG